MSDLRHAPSHSGGGPGVGLEPAPLVMKFGGTSVQDAEAMRGVVEVVAAERERMGVANVLVVTSACAGTTDALLATARSAGRGEEEARSAVTAISERHHAILAELAPEGDEESTRLLDELLSELSALVDGVLLLGELTPRTLDIFAAFGELLSSVLLTLAFRCAGYSARRADSRSAVITDTRHTDARPLHDQIAHRAPEALLPHFAEADVVVAQGFIGSTLDGETTTIGRGGSDHTAAILGGALGAPEIQIWTDVSGILTTDPRLVPSAHTVPEVSFGEARELARFGAKVLHPDTILPAVERSIPVVVKNTKRPADPGTRILPDSAELGCGAHAIALKRGLTRVRFRTTADFARALSRLAEHGVEPLSGGIVDGSGQILLDGTDDIIHLLLESSGASHFEGGLALLCIVGPDLPHDPGTIARAVASLSSVTSISAGHNRYGLLLTLPESEAVAALSVLHEALFG